MRYVSTRGEAPILGFEDAMLAGLAADGGLYVPEEWPHIADARIADMAGASYEEIAAAVVAPFTGEAYDAPTLDRMIEAAYADFGHPARAPLAQIGPNEWVLELHRGGTLAFKDFAMKLIGQMFEETLARRGARATIVGATSGDTGSAAIEAFKGLDAVDVFILYPHGRVSEVQRRQMTTPTEANVHALAVEGSFDDCQALVKAMFNDQPFRERVRLGAVNSINWARVMAQVVYYFSSAVSLGAPRRRVSFAVPTGNFGDIFAGWTAKQMGLPIDRLVIATNENDILHRALETGRYEVGEVMRTSSPSMDIQVSSNFERALWSAYGRDPSAVRGLMQSLKQSGAFTIEAPALAGLRADFDSARADQETVATTIRQTYEASGYLLDPHTAVGVAAAGEAHDFTVPMIALGCAHPAKFPDAVDAACGVRPELPPHLSDLFERPERATVLKNDLATLEAHIEGHARL
ncbi:MAG: threonine synthase [Pseudomonadota bacterium]